MIDAPVSCYFDAVYYQGNFYVNDAEIKQVSLHNRLIRPWSPLPISQLNNIIDIHNIEVSDTGVYLIEGSNSNIAHLCYDCIYPCWYGLFSYLPDIAINGDFQWLTMYPVDTTFDFNILKTFSGKEVKQVSQFSDNPIRLPWFMCGLTYGIGANHTNKEGCISITLPEFESSHRTDPIDTFVNRMYKRYNIIRNAIVPKDYLIIWIDSKRHQNNVENVIYEIKKQTNKDVLYVKWEDYSFKEQLKLVNKTGLIIVGVGTARFNTPFLPHGAIEVQTANYALWNPPSYIQYLDSHAGTITKYIKIKNVESYTEDECTNKNCSSQILPLVIESLQEIENIINTQIVTYIQRVDNVPQIVRTKLEETHKKYPDKFENWRFYTLSNDVSDYIYHDIPNREA